MVGLSSSTISGVEMAQSVSTLAAPGQQRQSFHELKVICYKLTVNCNWYVCQIYRYNSYVLL